MTTIHPYAIPIIAGNLRRTEFIQQLADTSEYLDFISQDIFNRIATRLNVYRAQLNKLDECIQQTNAHIDRIKCLKNSIQVHSSASYPVEQDRSTYKPLFEWDIDDKNNKPSVFRYNLSSLNQTNDKLIDHDDRLIVLKQYESNFEKSLKNISNSLGKPPTHIKSVVSFLKYNTRENPYNQATNIDPLNVTGHQHKQCNKLAEKHIVETPLTAFFMPTSKRSTTDNCIYNPPPAYAPQLLLPDNLPELDGLVIFANNTTVNWTEQQITSVACSFSIASTLPDTSELSSSTTKTVPSETTESFPSSVDLPEIISEIPVLKPVTPPTLLLPLSVPPSSPPLSTQTAGVIENSLPSQDESEPIIVNPVEKESLPKAHQPDSFNDAVRECFAERRARLMGETSLSPATTTDRFIVAPSLPSPPPPPPLLLTGDPFTNAIFLRAREIAEELKPRKSVSDDSFGD